MADLEIDDMSADDAIGGSEKIPCSDATAPKYITPTQLKNYVIDAIEAISAGTVVADDDKVFILDATDSVLRPVDVDLVTQQGIDKIWDKTAETSVDDADIFLVKDGGTTEKTVTAAYLAAYILAEIEASILDISDLADGSGALANDDYMLVTQGTTGKRIQVSDLISDVYDGLAAHVAGKNAVTATADADVFYCIQGGTAKKVALSDIVAHYGSSIDGSGTQDFLAQWADSDTLQAGPGITTSVAGFAAGSDSYVPTSKAVRDEMDTIINDATAIGAALADADTILVDDGAAGTTQRKSALSRVWTWIKAKTDFPLTAIDIDGGTDIGAGLADADLIVVDDGAGGTNRKSALSRMWTYIQSKLEAASGVSLTSAKVVTKLVFDESTNDLDVTASDQTSASSSVNYPDIDGMDATALVFPTAVDGTLAVGANANFEPTKLVYNKATENSGNEVIDLHDGTYLGQMLTIYFGTDGGGDAVLTPVTAYSYSTITMDTATEIATLQWQGATVGWAILYTNGTVA